MSGFLSAELGSLLGGAGNSGAAGNLLSEAFNAAGGVQGVMTKFDQAGLGDKVRSWVGPGSNLPITPDEITRVFPADQINAWAQTHGLPPDTATEVLAHLFPHAVDHATPDGQVPDQGDTQAGGQPEAQTGAQGNPSSGFDFGGLVSRFLR